VVLDGRTRPPKRIRVVPDGLFARMHGINPFWNGTDEPTVGRLETGEQGESPSGWCDFSQFLSRVPEPVYQRPRTGKPDAGDPPVRFGREGRSNPPFLPSSVATV